MYRSTRPNEYFFFFFLRCNIQTWKYVEWARLRCAASLISTYEHTPDHSRDQSSVPSQVPTGPHHYLPQDKHYSDFCHFWLALRATFFSLIPETVSEALVTKVAPRQSQNKHNKWGCWTFLNLQDFALHYSEARNKKRERDRLKDFKGP